MSAIDRLLSHDRPRSKWLAAALVVVVVMLALAPFLFPGAKSMSVVSKILVFILLVASYDLLLGYTGIVSFAHTMFFGIGGYGISIASTRLGEGWVAVGLGLALALAASLVLSLVIGLFSLRYAGAFLDKYLQEPGGQAAEIVQAQESGLLPPKATRQPPMLPSCRRHDRPQRWPQRRHRCPGPVARPAADPMPLWRAGYWLPVWPPGPRSG